MKKKNIILLVLVGLIILILGIGYYTINKKDEETTLTIVEKKWIESNKNKVIDLAVVNEIPVLNYNGKGLFFDFLTDLEKDTGLEFNKVSLSKGEEATTNYSFIAVNKMEKNDLLIYQDKYALVTNVNVHYNHSSELKDMTIGVLKDYLDSVDSYLDGASNVTFKSFEKVEDMIADLKSKEQVLEDGTVVTPVDAIVLPKTTYLKNIIDNNFYIAYQI